MNGKGNPLARTCTPSFFFLFFPENTTNEKLKKARLYCNIFLGFYINRCMLLANSQRANQGGQQGQNTRRKAVLIMQINFDNMLNKILIRDIKLNWIAKGKRKRSHKRFFWETLFLAHPQLQKRKKIKNKSRNIARSC